MQSKEKIVYYTELDESVKEPLAVIREFCEWSDVETVKKQMRGLLPAAMGAQYAGYEKQERDGRRCFCISDWRG